MGVPLAYRKPLAPPSQLTHSRPHKRDGKMEGSSIHALTLAGSKGSPGKNQSFTFNEATGFLFPCLFLLHRMFFLILVERELKGLLIQNCCGVGMIQSHHSGSPTSSSSASCLQQQMLLWIQKQHSSASTCLEIANM